MGRSERGGEPADDARRLREAFSALSERARPREDCPEPDHLWAAVRGELPARVRRELVNHISTCAACAEAWRLARELAPAPAVDAVAERRPSWLGPLSGIRWSWSYATLAGAAAAVLISVAIAPHFMGPGPQGPPGLRAPLVMPSPPGLRAPVILPSPGTSDARLPKLSQPPQVRRRELPVPESVPDSAADHSVEGAVPGGLVPGEEPVADLPLKWIPGPEGSLYHVTVTTEDLRPFFSARDLKVPRLLIPADKLAGLPAGTKLLWQVETQLPGDTRVRSETFVVRIR